MKNTYQPNSQQTIFDVALQFYGDVEGVRWILEDNPNVLNSDGVFDVSQKLKIRKDKIDPYVLATYNGYIPVTNGQEEGYEYILTDENNDFIIDDAEEVPVSGI